MSPLSVQAAAIPAKQTETQKKAAKADLPVDAKLKYLKEKVLPEAPYILGIRTLAPYRNHSQISDHWRKGTPFAREEEELQYLTFKDRTNDENDLYVRGGWDDGKGGIAPPEGLVSRTSSDGTPRQGQGPKKKITLADYKNRDKTKAAVGTSKPPSPKASADTKIDDKNGRPIATAKETTKPQQSEQHGQKRSADTMTRPDSNPSVIHHASASPTVKRARTTPEPPKVVSKDIPKAKSQEPKAAVNNTNVTVNTHRITPHGPKDSKAIAKATSEHPRAPTKEQKTQKATMHGLPPMLSPTLPPAIEEELAKITPKGSGGVADTKSSSASSTSKLFKIDRTPSPGAAKAFKSNAEKNYNAQTTPQKIAASTKKLNSTATSTPSSSPKPRQDPGRVTSAPRSEVGLSNATKAVSNGLVNGSKGSPAGFSRSALSGGSERIRLRVKLQIKKKQNRQRLGQYLRLKPTAGKYPMIHGRSGVEHERRSEAQALEIKDRGNIQDPYEGLKAGVKRKDPEPPKTGEKRRRSQDDKDVPEPSTKRHKTPGWLPQKTHTPKQPSRSSPISQVGSGQKSYLATPKADPKSTPMLRNASGEGSARTPQGLPLGGTPNAPDSADRRNSITSSGGQKLRRDDLKADANSFLAKARKIKHDSDVFLKKPGMSDDERKQGLVIAIESILCFMLAFTLFDEPHRQFGIQRGDVRELTGLKTIIQFLLIIRGQAKDFQHLSGLLLQLEGVIRDVIVYYDIQRLNRNPLEHELVDSAAKNASATEEQNRAAEYYRYFAEFNQHFQRAQSSWRTGWMALSTDELASKFPDTWTKREKHRSAFGKGSDAIKQGEYVRTVVLPMGPMTSGLEAVNFGMSILAEWCHREGVKWEPKLVL